VRHFGSTDCGDFPLAECASLRVPGLSVVFNNLIDGSEPGSSRGPESHDVEARHWLSFAKTRLMLKAGRVAAC
jgi:hypothetical protein